MSTIHFSTFNAGATHKSGRWWCITARHAPKHVTNYYTCDVTNGACLLPIERSRCAATLVIETVLSTMLAFIDILAGSGITWLNMTWPSWQESLQSWAQLTDKVGLLQSKDMRMEMMQRDDEMKQMSTRLENSVGSTQETTTLKRSHHVCVINLSLLMNLFDGNTLHYPLYRMLGYI